MLFRSQTTPNTSISKQHQTHQYPNNTKHINIQTKEKLGTHNYDPNCKYCVESNKKHFNHTSQLNEEIKNTENTLRELKTSYESLIEKIKIYDPTIQLKNRFSELETLIQSR